MKWYNKKTMTLQFGDIPYDSFVDIDFLCVFHMAP